MKLWNTNPITSIVKEQYYLAKSGISLTESTMLPDFEREAFINMLIKDNKREIESIKAKKIG